ncbi:MAG TPA: hypothetical protein VLJ60_06335, partial [bacterium]|nr:hypothetical protein [bacterium]
MKNLFLLTFFLIQFLTFDLYSNQSVQSIMLHNDGYKMFQEFRPNDTIFKNTIREMDELARKNKSKAFSESASLLKIIQSKCKHYYDTNTALIEHFKKKWDQPHYAKMEEEWKQTTFDRDRKKVKDVYSLTQGMLLAFNDWNGLRNKAVKMPTNEEIIKGISSANEILKKTIDAVLADEPAIFESISKELQII